MTEESFTCDVVIVGAGPVGMTAALLLAVQGVDVVVVERNSGPSNEPKAISLDDESLRAYQYAGIVDEVMEIIVPGTGTLYYDSNNEPLFHGRSAQPYRHGYPFKNPFAQPDLERVLTDALARSPRIRTLYGHTATELTRDADGWRLSLQGQSTRTVSARFVLGADGGRSFVRAALNIEMVGESHPEVWLVVDTTGDTRTERYGMHHADPRRPHVIVPGLDGRCRYEFLLFAGEGEPGDLLDFALIQQLLAPYRAITPEQVERAVNYRFHGLVAERWSSEGAFLLGDAAHMMPPFAGQGLNSGIRDAVNLTWKIAGVIHGALTPEALESYEQERKPHATAVVRSSERLGRVVMTTNARLASFRDRVVREALRDPERRDFFEEMRYRPVFKLEAGLVLGPARDGVGLPVGQPRAFDFTTRVVTGFDRMLGHGWSIVGVGVRTTDWAPMQLAFDLPGVSFISIPLDDTIDDDVPGVGIAIDVDTALYREFEPFRGHFLLVRPDRFIAARWLPAESATIADRARPWFTPQFAAVGPEHIATHD